MIPVYRPYLSENSFQYSDEACYSTWISSQGKFLSLASDKLKEMLGVKHVLLTSNGTCAVHLSAIHLYLAYPEITQLIVPNNVFVSAINGYLYDKKFQLVTCDADLETWNYDLSKLDDLIKSYGKNQIACLIVHNVGNVINVPALQVKYPNVVFVEDNCEGLFGKYGDQFTGTTSLNSAISFYGNKNVTCGEGGAFLTNDDALIETLYRIHNCGQSKTRFIHSELGYNYRMTNVAAGILLKQLEEAPTILEKKKTVFARYRESISQMSDVHAQKLSDDCQNPNWMFGVRFDDEDHTFEKANEYFKEHGIEIRPMFYPLSSHKFLHNNPNIFLGEETISKKLSDNVIVLPSFPQLSSEEQDHILKVLNMYRVKIRRFES